MLKQSAAVSAVAVVIAVPVIILASGADITGDGCVDLADYSVLQNQFTGPNCTSQEREIVSFFATGIDEFVLIPVVPGSRGVVLTDIISPRSSPPKTVELIQEDAADAVIKLAVRLGATGTSLIQDGVRSYHLQSGIPFDAGTTVKVITTGDMQITVSGYTY